MPSCAVFECSNRHEKHLGFSFYSFPFKKNIALEKWICFCNRGEFWIPNKNNKICGRHFEDKCFQNRPDIKRLVDGAIPTIKLENFIDGWIFFSDQLTFKI